MVAQRGVFALPGQRGPLINVGKEAVRHGADAVVPDDVSDRIDAASKRGGGAGDVDRREGALAEDEGVRQTGARILPDDIAARADAPSLCGGGTGDVDRIEGAIVQEIPVLPGDIDVRAGNVATVVDAEAERVQRSRDVDRGEHPGVEHEPVIDASHDIVADHLLGVVNPEHSGKVRPGKIYLGELTVFQQEAAGGHGAGNRPVVDLPDDVVAIVRTSRGRLQEARKINGGEGSLAEPETVRRIRAVVVEADDVAPSVYSPRGGEDSSRHVDGREGVREGNQRNTDEDDDRNEDSFLDHTDLSLPEFANQGSLP